MGIPFTEHARDTNAKKMGSCFQSSREKGKLIAASTDDAHSHTGPSGAAEEGSVTAQRREVCSGTLLQQRDLKEGRQEENGAVGRTREQSVQTEISKWPRQLGVTLFFKLFPSSISFSFLPPPFSLPTSFTGSQGSVARGSWPVQTLRGPSG